LQAETSSYIKEIELFNRVGNILIPLKALLGFKFLGNYNLMYEKLKFFEQYIYLHEGGRYFIEIVRQYMPAIYFIGFLESLIEALFLPFVLFLGIGLKSSKARNSAFMLFLASCYLLMLYYALIFSGHTRVRIFLAPTFILYPWIGAGMQGAVNYFKEGTLKRYLVIVLIFLLGVLSVYQSVDILWKQDDVTARAGRWLKERSEFRSAKIITTDQRVTFYADRSKDCILYQTSDYLSMERLALKKNADLLIIRISKKRERPDSKIRTFLKIKEFDGVKDMVSIYCSPKLRRAIKDKKL
jgi:hypothetical protein